MAPRSMRPAPAGSSPWFGSRWQGWLALAACLWLPPAWSQPAAPAPAGSYPDRPIKLVSPFPPGGPTDVMARVVGAQLAKVLGQPVVVENRAGAAGAIGADAVAKAPPDGYTLCYCTTGPLVTVPLLDSRLPYHPTRDLLPVSQVNKLELVLVARNGLEAQSIPELVALARSRPGRLTYAIPGMGGPNHLSVELLKTVASIDLLPVPFKGDQAALADLMGGHVDLFLGSVQSAAPLILGGKLKGIAVTGARRSALLPNVPTIAESGYPSYEASTFAGIHVPAGTPPAILARLEKAVMQALLDPGVRDKLAAEGMVPVGNTAAEYAQTIRDETRKWEGVMQRAGVKRE